MKTLPQIVAYLAGRVAARRSALLSAATSAIVERELRRLMKLDGERHFASAAAGADSPMIYRLDEWTSDGNSIVKTHAFLGDFDLAAAAWTVLTSQTPADRFLTWRQGARVIQKRAASAALRVSPPPSAPGA